MGYRIWRKDRSCWSLAFDTIYETQEKVTEAIEELNAVYHQLVKFGELQFLPYLDNINLNKDGSIKEPSKKNFTKPKYGNQNKFTRKG